MARLADLVLDCPHPASLARFWAEVLDGYAVAPYDDAELERLRSIGVLDPEDDPSVLVEGPGPRLFCQRVPEAKSAKNRMHVDLVSDDLDGEIARLLALGATRLDHQPPPGGDGLVALADPAGNEFCIRAAR